MRTSKGFLIAKALLSQNKPVKLLALEISDILEKHHNQEKLSAEETFLVGLRYSEFYSNGTTNEDYLKASEKRDAFLAILEVDFMDLYNATEEIYGRKQA